MKGAIKLLTLTLLILAGSTPLLGAGLFVEKYGYRLDPPEGWGQVTNKGVERLTFLSPDGAAALQIMSYPASQYSKAADMVQELVDRVDATGDLMEFEFEGQGAIFADLQYKSGSGSVRGYFIFINGLKHDYTLMAYTMEESYEQWRYFLLSALDSFALSGEREFRPGPVSTFYLASFPRQQRLVEVKIGKESYKVETSAAELETLRTLIDREVRVLLNYEQSPYKMRAWQRYYRVIYRDSYSRLSPLAAELEKRAKGNKELLIRELVDWAQHFTFKRTWGKSDLISPLESLITATGDCDSKALLLLILFHHFDVDALFLLSERFKHAAIGINHNFKGVGMSYNGKIYTYTELNEKVGIGKIARDVADPAGWTFFELDRR